MQFSEKLKKLRQEHNLTQAELADKLFVTRQAVTKWENGRGMPETNIALEIAKIFNVSLDFLMDDTQAEFREDIPNHNQGRKKSKKIKPFTKAIILGSCLICIIIFVLTGILISENIRQENYEKNEYVIGFYLTLNEVAFYDVEEVMDNDIPYYFSTSTFVIDEDLPRTSKYFNEDSIYISLSNHVYLYEITYVPKTKRYRTNSVKEISKGNREDSHYEYHSKEQDYFGHKYKINCNIYFLDTVESLIITAIDKNSQVIYDVTYRLNENGKIETSDGEILEFLPEQVALNDAVQYYVEYQTKNGQAFKRLFILGDDIMSTRCIVFMQKDKKLLDHDYLVRFYFH